MRKLNIGCGRDIKPIAEGWDNADIDRSLPNLTFVCDLTKVPVEDNTYDLVRASHTLEHIPLHAATIALAEWFRILKNGGEVWIDTPCITRNIELYLHGGWQSDFASLTPEQQNYCSLNGVPSRCAWLNFKVFSTDSKWNVHYANYDVELLSDMLHLAGFSNICVRQTDPSLLVTAVKP